MVNFVLFCATCPLMPTQHYYFHYKINNYWGELRTLLSQIKEVNKDIDKSSGGDCIVISLKMETSDLGESNLESPLCPNSQDRNHNELEAPENTTQQQQRNFIRCLRPEVVEEAKRQVWLAGPLIGVSLLQYSLQVIAIMFVGHLGNLPLSGASLASSFANVTGFSVLVCP